MGMIKLDYSQTLKFITGDELGDISKKVMDADRMLYDGSGGGSDFLGWVNLPHNYDREEFENIKKTAGKIRSDSDILVVIGIGGSYLGSKAILEALPECDGTTVLFAGNNLSPKYLNCLLKELENKEISLNVISKSGSTTEPSIAFRILRKLMEDKYGKQGASRRIYVTCDGKKGAMKEFAHRQGYETFVIPDDVGGRFSVLTPVGLLPTAVGGVNIDSLMEGARDASEKYRERNFHNNDCFIYAGIRNILYNKGKTVEILANFEPSLNYFNEWYKQLFGESEGKDNKGIFPAGVGNTADLHSMGQYIQEGRRDIFQTVLSVEHYDEDIIIGSIPDDEDGLNFLEGKSLGYINMKAMEGTIMAHVQGGVPNFLIRIPKLDAYHMGSLIYFFEKACGLSGYVLGVNPFTQPGVEAYKTNMFTLLEKPGYR